MVDDHEALVRENKRLRKAHRNCRLVAVASLTTMLLGLLPYVAWTYVGRREDERENRYRRIAEQRASEFQEKEVQERKKEFQDLKERYEQLERRLNEKGKAPSD